MPSDPPPARRYQLLPPPPGAVLKLGVIGAVVLAIAAAFAAVGGWFSPGRLTPARMIDAFEQVNGPHPGFRRNHAKGVCVAGHFDSNGAGQILSRAVVFRAGAVPVIGRFALAGGKPDMPDGPMAVRSMALSFRPVGGQEWRTGVNDIPVFPVRDARSFYEQLQAARSDPATGKPDPVRMKAFLAAHPETVRALALIKAQGFSSGFANATYNSLDAFEFVDAKGLTIPVRWAIVPLDPYAPEDATAAANPDKTYLFDALIARINSGPARWRLVITIGKPGDPTNDATIPWPTDRAKLDVGTLIIDHVEAEAPGNCRDLNFDPLVLPAGIAPSDDPLLTARSAAYSQSFTRRAGEPKTPSAVKVGG